MKVEVDVPSSPYGFSGRKTALNYLRAQELCESRGGRPRLPVPNSPYGLCRREATLNFTKLGAQELCKGRGCRPGLGSSSLIVLAVFVDLKQH